MSTRLTEILASSPTAAQAIMRALGPSTIIMGGVSLYVDLDGEDYYIEVEPVHNDLALQYLLARATEIGLELMDEDECPSITSADGSVRTYYAEVFP